MGAGGGSSIFPPGDSHPAGRENIECRNAVPAPLSPSRRKVLPLTPLADHSVSPKPNRHQNADHDHHRYPPAEAVAPASGNDLRSND
jgi:hypothetical protein